MSDPGPDGSATTVVVAEDNALLRDGLISMLQRFGFVVLAAVGTAEDLITAVSRCRPELVLTDVRMPPGFRDEGLRAAVRLRHDHPNLAIAVLSQYVEHTYAAQLLASGGSGVGYLLKDRVSDVRALVDALRDSGRWHRHRPRGGPTPPRAPTQPAGAADRARTLQEPPCGRYCSWSCVARSLRWAGRHDLRR